jgi:glycerophosphoryl diester phosphodiesterase
MRAFERGPRATARRDGVRVSDLPRPTTVPAVVAHRGASADRPEHTLAAYEAAIAAGADGLEADVRLTRDRHLVCVHDRRVDRTSDGRGAVSGLDLATLSTLDFGSWHRGASGPGGAGPASGPSGGRSAPAVAAEPQRLLTLAQLLELVCSSPRPVSLAVETKHPTRWSGLVERELAALLAHFGLLRARDGQLSQVRVMSFSGVALRRARTLMPAVARVQLTERPTVLAPSGTSVWGPSVDVLRRHPQLVRHAHDSGRAVHVWTVDSPADLDLCRDLEVDAVITNAPASAVAAFAGPARGHGTRAGTVPGSAA